MTDLNDKLTLVDLFAGCGGLSLGLEQAGFYPVYVNELNSDALETYLINRDEEHPHLRKKYFSKDIKDFVSDDANFENLLNNWQKDFGRDFVKNPIDVVAGGPPCQGFSGIGLRRSYSVEKKQLPSNHLYQDMAYAIHKIRPKIFLFENVEGLMRSRWTKDGEKGEIFKDVLNTFYKISRYSVRYKLVYGKDYGVPQNRPRILIIGKNLDHFSNDTTSGDALLDDFLPYPTSGYPNIEDIFDDLLDPNFQYGGSTKSYPKSANNAWQKYFRENKGSGEIRRKGSAVSNHEYSKHSEAVVERFSHMIEHNGIIPDYLKTKKFAQRLLPRTWGNKGPTITACSLPDDFVHYEQARSLTVREWARLQTFPDWYEFAGKRTTGGTRRAGNPRKSIFDREAPKYTQIGNAVPVKLAYEVGKHFEKLIKKSF